MGVESKWLCWLIRACEKKWKKNSDENCFKNTSLVFFLRISVPINMTMTFSVITQPYSRYLSRKCPPDLKVTLLVLNQITAQPSKSTDLTNKVLPSKEIAVFARRLSKSRSAAKSCPHPPQPYQRCTYTSSAHQVHVMFQTKWSPIKPGDERRPAETVNI